MDETLNQKIKVHCPEHHTTFETADSPKIVCEIREHALSIDFPNAEFWEYCCDCQIFSPSDLEVGGKAAADCPHCGRTMLRRFVCGDCKIISGDSGEDTKGKTYHVSETSVVVPSCPGCRKTFSGDNPHLHECAETEMVISTAREICPFCKKQTVKSKKAKPALEKQKCRKCRTLNEPNVHFCKECGEELRPNQNFTKRGSSTAKTMLLGSLCPTCGMGNLPDSVFCANCGQALKAEPKPPPPVPQSSVSAEAFTTSAFSGATTPSPGIKPKSSSSSAGLTAGGIVLVLVIACCVCFNSKSKNTDSSSSYSITNSNNSTSNYNDTPSNSSYGNSKMNGNSSGSLPDFDRDFSGTIGRRSFSMSLKRTGNDIRGTASTNRSDSLYGTIDSSGNFTLKGYENGGNVQTGTYSGKIYTDGSISGTWKNPQGGQARSFSLTEN